MTMDINNRKHEIKSDIQTNGNCGEERTEITPIKTTKRPFDVAFLMLPDEKLKQKQSKLVRNTYEKLTGICGSNNNNNNNDIVDEDEEIEVGNNQDFIKNNHHHHHHRYFPTQKQQIFDDPNLIKARNLDDLRNKTQLQTSTTEQKSAFTKVNLNSNKEMRLSPNLSISPDLSYQNSLSPSPPIINRNYPNTMLSPNQLFKAQQINAYQTSFLPDNFTTTAAAAAAAAAAVATTNLETTPFLLKNPNDLIQPNFTKIRPIYRPDLTPYNYQQFPTNGNPDMLKLHTVGGGGSGGGGGNGSGGGGGGGGNSNVNNNNVATTTPAAAAILTSLLPPSLAALSLPAQNVCAKCNISFRMTSDLVYHMRSHHKNDSVDMNRRRREEKLKCPVCAESFRERHHLTRHMTAHQDKDEDENTVKKSCI